ncbi:transcriptional repressor [Agaribacterium sp. ZY112]|uniref:transcriptional repressor n=1 Tax=Agaribacterium sp. ZY112 TaxID=3233574 RepID=UPI003523D580
MPLTFPVHVEKALLRAEHDCVSAGVRLTPKRKHLLALLLIEHQALTAYELVDAYTEAYGDKLPAMSVYRILQFLVEHKLVHKLETTNQFLACSHITCEHEHNIPQFLICDKCHKVEEIALRAELVKELRGSVERTGFVLSNQQLELRGLCQECSLAG